MQITKEAIELLPHFKQVTKSQCSSACPCGKAVKNGFIYWPERGNWWCRKCDERGFVDDDKDISQQDKRELVKQAEERRILRLEEDKLDYRQKVEHLQISGAHLTYHHNLIKTHQDQLGEFAIMYGIGLDMVEKFTLGYASKCPTSTYSDSFTIPYFWRGEVINLRHRLLKPNGNGKYRPEMAGLRNAIYNADALLSKGQDIILVEGEFKAIVLEQLGYNTVAIAGKTAFKETWAALFKHCKKVLVCLDPDAENEAKNVCELIEGYTEARLVDLPVKPDDFFVEHSQTTKDFNYYLSQARRIV